MLVKRTPYTSASADDRSGSSSTSGATSVWANSVVTAPQKASKSAGSGW